MEKVLISVYNTWTKQKDIRFEYDSDRVDDIRAAQKKLLIEIKYKAFDVVLAEIV